LFRKLVLYLALVAKGIFFFLKQFLHTWHVFRFFKNYISRWKSGLGLNPIPYPCINFFLQREFSQFSWCLVFNLMKIEKFNFQLLWEKMIINKIWGWELTWKPTWFSPDSWEPPNTSYFTHGQNLKYIVLAKPTLHQ